uniref:Uncharacterized protein n=1 Tax=Rhizophora mucronata TaxID=61149 RepID=A0A2P2LZL5_RHIMU
MDNAAKDFPGLADIYWVCSLSLSISVVTHTMLFKFDIVSIPKTVSVILLREDWSVCKQFFVMLGKILHEFLIADQILCHPMHANSSFYLSTSLSFMQPDSLGPLDLDIPSSKHNSEDLILSDSLSGLNLLIASSLDAFQNCSFLGLDKKDTSTVENQETISFSGFKIGSGV